MTTTYAVHPSPLPAGVVSACAYESDGLEEGVHRGLPSPWVTFIVSVDGPVRIDGDVGSGGGFDPARARSFDVLVAGLHEVAAQVEQPRRQSGVQLALHPLAVESLLGCRARDLGAASEDARDVLGVTARELHERVGSTSDLHARVRLVVAWLARRAEQTTPRVRPEVARAWQLLRVPGARVDRVAREVQLSPRQLRTLMVQETGWAPKPVARLARFSAVVGDLGGGADLAGSAVRRGYADQSHLTREFTQMAGCSPTAWLAEERRNLQDGGHHTARESVA